MTNTNRIEIDAERLAEIEASSMHKGAAARAIAVAANLVANGAGFGRKVFLCDLADALAVSVASLRKLAAYWHRLGWVELTRLDLPGAGADFVAKAARSEVAILESTYHLIVVES